jgi:hypothetical protein
MILVACVPSPAGHGGNQPGELAGLCEAMASSGINLVLCAAAQGRT